MIASTVLYATFAINLFNAAYTDPGVLLRPKNYQSLKEAEDVQKDRIVKEQLEELKEKSKQDRIEIEQQLIENGASEDKIRKRLKQFDDFAKFNVTYEGAERKYEFDQSEIERKSAETIELDIPHIFTERYWKTWFIWRPSLASHWSYWNQWVRGFDHHCAVFNGWVGERNIRNFVYMLFSSSTLSFIQTLK